jgi:hypothetical protein
MIRNKTNWYSLVFIGIHTMVFSQAMPTNIHDTRVNVVKSTFARMSGNECWYDLTTIRRRFTNCCGQVLSIDATQLVVSSVAQDFCLVRRWSDPGDASPFNGFSSSNFPHYCKIKKMVTLVEICKSSNHWWDREIFNSLRVLFSIRESRRISTFIAIVIFASQDDVVLKCTNFF